MPPILAATGLTCEYGVLVFLLFSEVISERNEFFQLLATRTNCLSFSFSVKSFLEEMGADSDLQPKPSVFGRLQKGFDKLSAKAYELVPQASTLPTHYSLGGQSQKMQTQIQTKGIVNSVFVLSLKPRGAKGRKGQGAEQNPCRNFFAFHFSEKLFLNHFQKLDIFWRI